MSGTELTGGQRAVQATMRALAAIPLVTGALGALGGTRAAPGGGPAPASVDSEYRFASLFWAAAGGVLLWSAQKPAERARISRGILGLAGLGAVPRALSWSREGAPHPVFRAALALEAVGMPAVLAWHGRQFPGAR